MPSPVSVANADTPQASPDPAYSDFVNKLVAARTAQASASPTSLWNWLSGRQVDAAKAGAMLDAPAVWDAYKQAQAASRNTQLGTAASLASQGAMANTNIDPNNIDAAIPALQQALSGVYGPQPTNGAPADPIAQRRAFYDRYGNMLLRIPGMAPIVKDIFSLRDQGVPKGATVAADGTLHDAVSGKPLVGDVGSVEAAQAQPTKVMETNEAIRQANHQAGLDIGVHTANANTDAARDLVNGIDPMTGQPVTRTRADIVQNGGFVSNNPYFESQQAELKDLRTKSESADQGLNLGTQIVNAANGVITGKGANALQDVRKLAQTAANLSGAKLDPAIDNDTSKFEQLKFASQQLVAVASHELSPRVAQNIYQQIAAVKPGDATSIQGLRDIIVRQLIPVFQRNKALFGATADYYKRKPLSNDAASAVPDSLPLSNFGVRDYRQAQPGDYFIDPRTGDLRVRPR